MKFFRLSRHLSFHLTRSRRVTALLICVGWAALTVGSVSLSAATVTAKKENKKPGPGVELYRRAERSFARQKLADAQTLLDRAEAAGGASRADVLNLRGAILLRQNHYSEARQKFNAALAVDPSLWVARYNLAEVDLQEGRYGDSRQRLAGVLRRAPKSGGGAEVRDFVQYKLLLADLLAGREEPVIRYLSEHRSPDARRPDAVNGYLNAALAYHRGQTAEAQRWQARARRGEAPAELRQLFAASFDKFGNRLVASANPDGARNPLGNVSSRTSRETNAASANEAGIERRSETAQGDRAAATKRGQTAASLSVAPPAPDRGAAESAGESSTDSSGVSATPASVAMVQLLSAPPLARSTTRSPRTLAGKPRSEPSPASAGNPSEPPGATPSIGDTLPSFRPSGASSGPMTLAAASPTPKEGSGGASASPAGSRPTPAPGTTPEPPSDAFNTKYEAAFLAFTKRDYPTSLALLQEADTLQPGQADSSNLRGLIFARQRLFERAETEFKRAVQLDPTFWAAKFNLADLPFSYRNYGMARTRFETLLADIDPAQLPREMELTQFKIFLCLLLEGKESSARAWMARFKFEGTTPARLYAQAALDFHDGNFARAVSWMDSAKKQFPPQLEALFAESFYRIGWLTNNSATLAQNQPPGSAATPDSTIDPPLELPSATPTPPPPSLSLAIQTPSPELEPRAPLAASSASPLPTATPPPAIAVATPSATPQPAASTNAASPTPSRIAATASTPAPTASDTPSAPAPVSTDNGDWIDRLVRVILPAFVLLYVVVTPFFMAAALLRRSRRKKSRRFSVPSHNPSDNLTPSSES